MKSATTRQRLQRIRAGATRHVQQGIARAEAERAAHQAALDDARAAMDAETSADAGLMAVRDTCRLRMLPELRRLQAELTAADAALETQRAELMDAWRQEKLADEMVSNERDAAKVEGRRKADAVASEAGAQLWWRNRAA